MHNDFISMNLILTGQRNKLGGGVDDCVGVFWKGTLDF